MQLSEFDYHLPEELIAQTPVEPRNSSRMMVLDPVEKTIEHKHFYDLKEYLEPGDTLIMNDTRVMQLDCWAGVMVPVARGRVSFCAVLMVIPGKLW